MAVALMLMGLALPIVVILLGIVFPPLMESAKGPVGEIDFYETLMDGMLSFLLFAGALHVKQPDLYSQKRVIGLLATVGVLVSTFTV